MFAEAQLYSDTSFCQQKKAARMLIQYADWFNWEEDENVLDIGSGPGIITEQMLMKFLPCSVKRVIGGDVSNEMVQHSRKNCRHPKLSFYSLDITEPDPEKLVANLPSHVVAEGFNKVFCFYLLHWLHAHWQQGVDNVYRLLRPGGQGVAIQYTRIPVFDTYVIIGQTDKWSSYLKGIVLDHNPLRTQEDPEGFMFKSLSQAGFLVDDISTYSSHNVYAQMSDLMGLMTSIDPFLQHIPEELHSDYMEDFFNILLPKCDISQDGCICIPFTILTCAFTKPY